MIITFNELIKLTDSLLSYIDYHHIDVDNSDININMRRDNNNNLVVDICGKNIKWKWGLLC